MPAQKRIPDALPQDELLLAAIDRADRHQAPSHRPGIPLSIIKQHAGIPHTGWSTLQLRPQLERLEAAKLILRSKHHGNPLWTLTAAGERQLAAVRAAGTLQPLPESPQHRRWREAQQAARLEIDQLRTDLGLLLNEAMDVFHESPQASSEVWLDLARRLANACSWLGSATYCLHEWPEPNDSTADLAYGGPREIIPWSRHRTAPGVASATVTRVALAPDELTA